MSPCKMDSMPLAAPSRRRRVLSRAEGATHAPTRGIRFPISEICNWKKYEEPLESPERKEVHVIRTAATQR